MGKTKHINNQDSFQPFNKLLSKACIIDVDGTLALSNRNIYDYEASINDTPLKNSIILYNLLYNLGYKMIILTARPNSCRKTTEAWLKHHVNAFGNFELLMRKTGDSRHGSIVKEEIYLEEIKDRYDVQFVVDDSVENINIFRKYKLFTLQVVC